MSLKSEIETGPLADEIAPFLAAGNLDAVLGVLNDSERYTKKQRIPRNVLAGWMASNGVRARLEDYSTDPNHALRSLSLAMLDVVRGGAAEGFDVERYEDAIDYFESQGGLNSTEKAELLALADVPASRAEILFGRQITLPDLWEALK